jgi:hypothetical protein
VLWTIYPVCATNSAAWAASPALNPDHNPDKVNPAVAEINLADAEVSLPSRANSAATVNRASNPAAEHKGANPASKSAQAVATATAMAR